jgi:hypothetical protein
MAAIFRFDRRPSPIRFLKKDQGFTNLRLQGSLAPIKNPSQPTATAFLPMLQVIKKLTA